MTLPDPDGPPNWTLRAHRDVIDVTTNLPRPDPNWRHTDRAGHRHHMQPGRAPYPTLRTVVDDAWWCSDCADEHTDRHLECAQCGETITPGTVGPGAGREYAPGPATYSINDQPITEAQYAAYLERAATHRSRRP